ncbi:tetratricopeptide repeat protein, partial [Akkermansiaceae bacterium]|nr:tetratricopeptide repeat protein [Akkermansiaceae bacterium]
LGDLNHAEATLARIEEEISGDLRAGFLSQRGDLHSHRGHYAEAEKDYREANKLDSNEGEYLIFAAQAAFQQGEVARAEYLIREAIAVGGEVLDEAYGNLAGYLVAQQRYQEAKTCYEKVVSLDPGNEHAREWIVDLNRVLKMLA